MLLGEDQEQVLDVYFMLCLGSLWFLPYPVLVPSTHLHAPVTLPMHYTCCTLHNPHILPTWNALLSPYVSRTS